MIKNIIILILGVLLFLVVTERMTHKEVLDLGNKTKDVVVDLFEQNKNYITSKYFTKDQQKELLDKGLENLLILKDYTFDNILTKLESKDGQSELTKSYQKAVMEKYNLSTIRELKAKKEAWNEYQEGLKQIRNGKYNK